MKNKEITMYELIGLIKDNKAPKRIRWNYTDLNDDKIYIWYDWAQGYYEEGHAGAYDYKLLAHRNVQYSKILNSKVEIIEKNDEWEDICELFDDSRYNFSDKQNGMTQEDRRLLDSNFKILGDTINQLIKNQKYLKERLDKDE